MSEDLAGSRSRRRGARSTIRSAVPAAVSVRRNRRLRHKIVLWPGHTWPTEEATLGAVLESKERTRDLTWISARSASSLCPGAEKASRDPFGRLRVGTTVVISPSTCVMRSPLTCCARSRNERMSPNADEAPRFGSDARENPCLCSASPAGSSRGGNAVCRSCRSQWCVWPAARADFHGN